MPRNTEGAWVEYDPTEYDDKGDPVPEAARIVRVHTSELKALRAANERFNRVTQLPYGTDLATHLRDLRAAATVADERVEVRKVKSKPATEPPTS